jgi:hypothetical protein
VDDRHTRCRRTINGRFGGRNAINSSTFWTRRCGFAHLYPIYGHKLCNNAVAHVGFARIGGSLYTFQLDTLAKAAE